MGIARSATAANVCRAGWRVVFMFVCFMSASSCAGDEGVSSTANDTSDVAEQDVAAPADAVAADVGAQDAGAQDVARLRKTPFLRMPAHKMSASRPSSTRR